MSFMTLSYLPGAMARLQWSLERMLYAIGRYRGATSGLLSPVQRVLWGCDGSGL